MIQRVLSKWNPEICCAYIWQPYALEVRGRQGFWQWKWKEGGLGPSWGQGLGPVPGTGRSFIFFLGHTQICLSLPRKPAFPSYLPWEEASAGSRPWTGLHFPAGLSPGQPVVHLYLRGTALTKPLALFGNPFPVLSQTKLIWNGWVNVTCFLQGACVHLRGGGSPGDSPRLSLGVTIPTQCRQSALRSEAHTWNGEGPGASSLANGWRTWSCLAYRRENSGRFWELSQWAVNMGKVYFGISQRKIGTNVEKFQGGKLP